MNLSEIGNFIRVAVEANSNASQNRGSLTKSFLNRESCAASRFEARGEGEAALVRAQRPGARAARSAAYGRSEDADRRGRGAQLGPLLAGPAAQDGRSGLHAGHSPAEPIRDAHCRPPGAAAGSRRPACACASGLQRVLRRSRRRRPESAGRRRAAADETVGSGRAAPARANRPPPGATHKQFGHRPLQYDTALFRLHTRTLI